MKKEIVMLIDDSSTILKAFERMLGSLDVEVLSYDNPVLALEDLETKIPTIIITDFEMPHLNGHELLIKIKQNEKTASIPVIILTSHDEDKNMIECLQEGADDYVLKRSNPEVFLTKIDNFLKLARYRRMEKEESQLETYKATVSTLNHEFNNIIQMVDSYLEIAERKENTTEIREKLEAVMHRLVDKIKSFEDLEKIEIQREKGHSSLLKTN